MDNKIEFVSLPIQSKEEQQKINKKRPILRVKNREVEMEIYQGIER
ncbi:hypothetical protein ACYSNO_06535 [Enterococcus sp. LJL98]